MDISNPQVLNQSRYDLEIDLPILPVTYFIVVAVLSCANLRRCHYHCHH
jgi:hypothetical protein